MMKNYQNACRAILLHYGEKTQIIKTIEELSELIKALSRVAAAGILISENKEQNASIIEEIADCKIMLAQLEEIIETRGQQKTLGGQINYKLGRTLEQISREKED
ncbi:hypothetical protein MASR1M12_01090 [Erysipelotrichia bacterium]